MSDTQLPETIDIGNDKLLVVLAPLGTEEAQLGFVVTDKIDDKTYQANLEKYYDETEGTHVMGKVLSVTLVAAYVNPHIPFEPCPYIEDIKIDGGLSMDKETGIITYYTPEEMESFKDITGL